MAHGPDQSVKRRLPLAERQCGTCTACCTLVGVESIGKPGWAACKNERDPFIEDDPGCRVYESRPDGCRTYQCLWLLGALDDEDDRPDRLGVMIDAYRMDDGSTGLVLYETRPNGFLDSIPRLRPHAVAAMKRTPPRPTIVRWYGGLEVDQWDGIEVRPLDFELVDA